MSRRCQAYSLAMLAVVAVVVAVVIAVVVALLVTYLGNDSSDPVDEIVVVVATHDTKELLMDRMQEIFNDAGLTIVDQNNETKRVRVQVCHTGASFEEDACADGQKPTLWSPPNRVWIERNILSNPEAAYVNKPVDCTDTTSIPIGIGIWRDMAEALGWPDQPLGWDDILELILYGWGSIPGIDSVTESTWGSRFLYGHGHPVLSNSGSLSWVSAVHSFANVSFDGVLTTSHIYGEAVRNLAAQLSSAVEHMGKIEPVIPACCSELRVEHHQV